MGRASPPPQYFGLEPPLLFTAHFTEQNAGVWHDGYCVLFCSLAVLDPRIGHTVAYCLRLSLSSVILIESSTGSPVHVLMLSIQAVRGLPRLRALGIVPCIISFP